MKKHLLFIVNPIAGGKDKQHVPQLIKNHLNAELFDYAIVYSKGVLHAYELAKANLNKYDFMIAVGGDGTINEVATALVHTPTALGVIPYGSGNGLARFLGMATKPSVAIQDLNNYKIVIIDAATCNDRFFFNMAGMGLDAQISKVFSSKIQRGFYGYLKAAIHTISYYQPEHYCLDIDGTITYPMAFMISIANSSQYGYHAHIAPNASVQDGFLDICVVQPFSWYKFPLLALRLFTKTVDRFKYVRIFRGQSIKIVREKANVVHIDGESCHMGTLINIKVVPASLRVLVKNL